MARRRSARLQEAQDKTSTGIKRDQANTQLQDLEANIPSTKKVNVSRDDQVGGLVVGPPDRAGGDTRLDEEDESIDANDKGFLNDMPPEIFQEVTAYLGPDDILCLARLNRVLRNLLMSKSARFIWRTSFQNFLPSIPPLPADLNELQMLGVFSHSTLRFTDLSGLSPVSETFEKLISCVPSYMIFDEIIHQYKYVYAIGWTLELYKEYRELSQDRKNAWLKEKRDVLQNLYEVGTQDILTFHSHVLNTRNSMKELVYNGATRG
ncbi:hypothetical protein V5O48_017034 [Marasmius crinis-equi]|uniref:F-box domain-containing protein n=1 Tax=Marasmius crinis-equi TaxID=585013 RepID=A0ABR3EQ36_9AGAR